MADDQMPSHHGVQEPPQARAYPNETLRLLIERSSCRSFEERAIPPDVLASVLEAGVRAPTGGNLQPYSIIKIENAAQKQVLAERCEQGFIATAPVLLVFCIDWHRIERWANLGVAPFTASSSFRHFWISFQDTVICAQNVCTAADALGLGSVYIGTVLEFMGDLKEMLALPQKVFPVVLLCLGYPKHRPQPRRKLGTDVIVHSERYQPMADRELLDAFERKYLGHRVKATRERLDVLSEVCEQVHGQDFAERCVQRVQETGYIRPAQRYFGLDYRADLMPLGNEDYLQLMKDCGFGWFETYHPAGAGEG